MSETIDSIISKIERKKTNLFNEEISRRRNFLNINIKTSNELLEHLSNLIAFSQQANSALVETVIKTGSLKKALSNFKIEKVVKLNPCNVIEKHWQEIKGIRQQSKIFHIIMLSRVINSNPEVLNAITQCKIPKNIETEDQIEEFWREFAEFKKTLKNYNVPFFRETTSLLHLLLSLGFDCVKPDSAVMNAAMDLEIIDSKKGEKNLIKAVTAIQQYSISKNRQFPPAILDLYLLIHGEQADAQKYVDPAYFQEKNSFKKLHTFTHSQ